MENFRSFRRLASNREGFPANFSFLLAIRCFELLYNRESFPTNNKKIMQPRNFSTANDLHYTVCNSYNIGMRDLSDIYARGTAYKSDKSQVPML